MLQLQNDVDNKGLSMQEKGGIYPEFVIKRDGQKVKFDLQKWQTQIAKVCEGVADVSPSMIEISARPHFYAGMTTKELDDIALKAMVSLIDEELNPEVGNSNYQYVAGKQRLTMLRKDVYGSYTPPSLYSIIKKNVELKLYTPDLLTWYTEDEWNQIDSFIDHEKDEEYSYAAIEQFIEKYLVRNRVTHTVVETPQVRYAVIAATAHAFEKINRLKYVKEFYADASDNLFTLATPVCAGLGTNTKQFSSCVVMSIDDTLKSIFATGQVMADYASKRAGIGLDVGKIRAIDSPIRNGEIAHTGLLPFLKKLYGDLRSCSQGGIRNASATVNLPIWHYQFDDFVVLKNNKGTEEARIRHLDYCIVVSKLFWRRLKQNGVITFFNPKEVPDLYTAFYADIDLFDTLYAKYEKRTDIRKKVVSAKTVMRDWLITERQETSRIYLLNIDNVQKQGTFDTSVAPVVQTNLCTEITIPSKPFQTIDDENGRIGLCTLGSMNYGAFKNPEDMRKPVKRLQRALHNLLQYQDFLSVQSKLHNDEYEPLGIGVTNLAYWHAKRKLKYGDPTALAEIKKWIEHQAFYLTEGSVDLAKEKGPCKLSHTTLYGKGFFPWEKRAEGVNELTDFTPCEDLDWETLRQKMITYGVRNAVTMAIAPVESSSVILNSTNGISMVKQLIISKKSKAGDFVQVVPEYKKLKKHYQLLWDQPDCENYVKMVAVLQAYVDQGISADTFFEPGVDGKVDVNRVISLHMNAHKWGVKSFYYALTNKQAALDSIKADEVREPVVEPSNQGDDEEYCESCVL